MGRVRDSGNKSYGAVRIGTHGSLADGETITIGDLLNGGKRFEFRAAGPATGSNILVLKGADAAAAIVALRDAINAQFPGKLVAYVDPVSTAVLRIEGAEPGALGNLAFTTTMAHATNIIAAVAGALAAGDPDKNVARASGVYVVTALDVLATNLMIPTPFAAPVLGSLRVVTSADVPKYFTSKPTISGSRIKITDNGATPLAAGDKVYWEVWSGD
jgi:hypothetical protein